ncbi:MAG: cupin domain-containing protein [SAR202 cluster bacterium]|nr:cupin domain-containing protein [SAR202 cluster bacterium]
MDLTQLPSRYDALAPDGSEIRLLLQTGRASMVHCSLPQGSASKAVAHRTIEEIWFFLEGFGQVWRRLGDDERVVDVVPGSCLTIPTGAHFQFRNTGSAPLRFVIATMPPWPGQDEAYRVPDHWPVDTEVTGTADGPLYEG